MLKIPPPVWMFIYLAIAGALSLAFAFPHFGNVPLGIALTALGAAIAFWGRYIFHVEGTQIMPTSETNKKLVQRGPFAFTRNPMYLGLVTFSLGLALWIGAAALYAVPVAMFITTNWVHIPFEEAKMRRQYGIVFDDYAKRVRRWI